MTGKLQFYKLQYAVIQSPHPALYEKEIESWP